MIDSDKGGFRLGGSTTSILTMNLLDLYYTRWEVGCQVKFWHREHREEEIRNTKHEIRNNIKSGMLEWPKREGTTDDGAGCIVLDTSQNLTGGYCNDEFEEMFVGGPGFGACGRFGVRVRFAGDPRLLTVAPAPYKYMRMYLYSAI